jgi:hypothetical protein
MTWEVRKRLQVLSTDLYWYAERGSWGIRGMHTEYATKEDAEQAAVGRALVDDNVWVAEGRA